MKAFGIIPEHPHNDPTALMEFEAPMPEPSDHDILVKVRAVAVNPVDTKIRASLQHPLASPRILGWDASGEVMALGAKVNRFQPGDHVFYAGDVTRAGCNSEWHCVDERLVSLMPLNLDFAQSASLPLTSLTAWEGMVERMRIQKGRRILIISGAGGVGSIAIQIAKYTGLHVTATASRPESRNWCINMGANDILDHSQDLATQCHEKNLPPFDYIANFTNTEMYWPFMSEWIAPLGHLLLIVEPRTELRIGDPLKAKCVSIHWEFMFARSKFQTPCIANQGAILKRIAGLIEQGQLRHTMHGSPVTISAPSLRAAHTLMQSSRAIGKHVLTF